MCVYNKYIYIYICINDANAYRVLPCALKSKNLDSLKKKEKKKKKKDEKQKYFAFCMST